MTRHLTDEQIEKAKAQFTEWFVKNYPGPDTIIGKPEWHAPRIFSRAQFFITRAPEPGELERLRAENERLREGLKPFSEEAAAWVDHMPDGEPLWISLGPGFDPMPSKISINDLRRARAALAEGGGE